MKINIMFKKTHNYNNTAIMKNSCNYIKLIKIGVKHFYLSHSHRKDGRVGTP
jgi:hypothetical protein